MSCPFLIFSQSDYLIQIVDINSHNGKQCRSRSVGFFRSPLIWIYTVCKGRTSGSSSTRVKTVQMCRLICLLWAYTSGVFLNIVARLIDLPFSLLTLKVPITTAADDNFLYFFIIFFSEKTSLDISCESSAWQTIHMKCQDLYSLKKKKKKKKI